VTPGPPSLQKILKGDFHCSSAALHSSWTLAAVAMCCFLIREWLLVLETVKETI
jgi:hypothetical protein